MTLYSDNVLLLGAVAYDPKVVTIWEGFKMFFENQGQAFDYILYSNYERQVEAQLKGDVHVTWNSPLAWIEAERIAAARGKQARAVAMRDTDLDLKSVILVRADAEYNTTADLKGRTVAVGASDSPQSTLIPLMFLADQGLEPGRDFEVREHNLLPGKHGDHVGGEREACRALSSGDCDAACINNGNYLAFTQEGTLPSGSVKVLGETGLYDHSNFTVIEEDVPAGLLQSFREILFSMDYSDPEVRPLFDLEGLTQWEEGRTTGYDLLNRAVDRFEFAREWMARLSS